MGDRKTATMDVVGYDDKDHRIEGVEQGLGFVHIREKSELILVEGPINKDRRLRNFEDVLKDPAQSTIDSKHTLATARL